MLCIVLFARLVDLLYVTDALGIDTRARSHDPTVRQQKRMKMNIFFSAVKQQTKDERNRMTR